MGDPLRVVGRTRLTTRGSTSAAVTIPPEARDVAVVGEGSTLAVRAKAGEVCLVDLGRLDGADGRVPRDDDEDGTAALASFGERTIRRQGEASVYVTLPKEAVAASEFEQDSYLEIAAAPAVLRLRTW